MSKARFPIVLGLFAALTAESPRFVTKPLENGVVLEATDIPVGQLTLHEGDTALSQRLLHGSTAHLTADLTVVIADQSRTLTAADELDELGVLQAPIYLPAKARTYCASFNTVPGAASASKAVVGVVAFGMFKGLQRTELLNRFCLIDFTGSGAIERVVLVGAKREGDLMPVKIAPVPLVLEHNVPFKAPSGVSIKYLGPVGLTGGSLGFEVVYQVVGQKIPIAAPRAVAARAELPKQLVLPGGAQLTVLAYDDATKTATVRVDKSFDPGPPHFGTPPPQPIYVYVPRMRR